VINNKPDDLKTLVPQPRAPCRVLRGARLAAGSVQAPGHPQGGLCRAYTPGTHTRKDEDGLLLEFPCNPTRTRYV
jgi:hypothetical protein